VIVDNASQELGDGTWGFAGIKNAKIVREERLGLTHARVRGFGEAKGEIVVMVDDDNLLRPDYLERAVEILGKNPLLGAIGGKALPGYETEPPEWLKEISSGLGLRDLGDSIILYPDANKQDGVEGGWWKVEGGPSFATNLSGSGGAWPPETCPHPSDTVAPRWSESPLPRGDSEGLKTGRVRRKMTEFPDCAPIGAGMVIRREAALEYVARIKEIMGEGVAGGWSRVAGEGEASGRRVLGSDKKKGVVTDRKGKSLSSGGDNDICLTVLEHGWQVGYFPQLELTHLIPKERMTAEYQSRMARDAMRSYIVMLDQHGIRPWPAMARWMLPVKMVRSLWRTKPWIGVREKLSFENAMGQFLGRADIGPNP
jgi:GT2 family glycosyltransferase